MKSFDRRIIIKLAYIVIDMVCIVSSFLVACWLNKGKFAFDPNFEPTLQSLFLNEGNPYRFVFIFWVLISIFVINAYGLYQTRREILESIELSYIVRAVIIASLAAVVVIYGLKLEGFPRGIFLSSTILIICTLAIWRVIKRYFIEYLVVSGYNNMNVLIIGAGKVGQALAEEIKRRPGFGLNIVGFLDDFKTNDPENKDVKILGTLADFQRIARQEFVHKIFITIHPEGKIFLDILENARDMSIAIRVIPQGFEVIKGEFYKYNIGVIPILEYTDIGFTKEQFVKRTFDLTLSLAATIAMLPIFLIVGIIIKMDSKGPVFYLSKRYGRKGQVFHMYKFRSMSKDADKSLDQMRENNEVDGPIFKMKKDPRITKVGRALRKYSIDELPQIINVLKGEMSLVGPRPLPIEQVEKEDLKQLKRLEVRPGITGLWQIRGRSDVSFSRLVRWDNWYIKNWSLWLDLNILFLTVPVVIKGKGAY